MGGRMPCPTARPVKDDRVLACASALDPCNSGRCPLSPGGLVCAPPASGSALLQPPAGRVAGPVVAQYACLELP